MKKSGTINLTLKVWRQKNSTAPGALATYTLRNIATAMSFLEMLDVLNEQLLLTGEEPVAFDHDCREGICGMCGAVVNGLAHGPEKETTLCQLHMRHFTSGDTLMIEPYRARAFKVVKELVVDRSAFDALIQEGGYVSVNVGGAQDANALPISRQNADQAMDAAACIGCGACVAACPNAAAMLFVSGKVSQLALLPQGHPERKERALNMVKSMDEQGFGNCSNERECEAACPKAISIRHIARLNREYLKAALCSD
ncbi:MAG: succinate dehydrogenase/fumarate reductase iron-sulfur subunit [Deltaproteobacteria bacterium]|jgi:succinate dehydrogenase / fumarate reductase iron-sulfur subunit|nr:succinate dehydrogenase/fumarate reductase iron-sulfur subunit [Deltaproteobacteria bacterium]